MHVMSLIPGQPWMSLRCGWSLYRELRVCCVPCIPGCKGRDGTRLGVSGIDIHQHQVSFFLFLCYRTTANCSRSLLRADSFYVAKARINNRNIRSQGTERILAISFRNYTMELYSGCTVTSVTQTCFLHCSSCLISDQVGRYRPEPMNC
jgi:hypothetical protein